MNPAENSQLDEITFHLFLPWYLAKIGFLLLLSTIFIGLALRHHVAWALGLVVIVLTIVRLAAQYATQKVIIRGNDLVLHTGVLSANEHIIPIWRAELETAQSLFGRLFDYGTVRYRASRSGEQVELRQVASIRALRFLAAERRRYLLATLLEPQVVMANIELTAPRWGQGGSSLRTIIPSRPRT